MQIPESRAAALTHKAQSKPLKKHCTLCKMQQKKRRESAIRIELPLVAKASAAKAP
jgi:hypothetical protein